MVLRTIWRVTKYVFLAVAAVVLVGGAALALLDVPSDVLPFQQLVRMVGHDYLVIVPVAGLGLLFALLFAYHGRTSKIQQAGTPDAEDVETVPVPGDDLDGLVDTAEGLAFRSRTREARGEVRERLRRAAVAVLVSQGNSGPEARSMVDSGSWTADKRAASAVGGDEAPPPPLSSYVPFGRSSYRRGVEAAINEIHSLAEEDA
ncbi:MAG: DUF7269 family protein [Halobacteriota archaeon]